MQAVFGEQNVRQEPWPGAPARDRMRWRRRLGDGLAAAAGELLTDVPQYFLLDPIVLPHSSLRAARSHVEVFDKAIPDGVHPAVNREGLTARPCL